MDGQTFFNIAIAIIGTLGAWVLNTIWSELKTGQSERRQLADKIANIEVLVAGKYITRDEFQHNLQTLFSKLDGISDKINAKADR